MYSRIKYIEDGSYSQLKSLQRLILRGNELQSISQYTFLGLHALYVLDLSENKLASISTWLFNGSTSLYDLYFNFHFSYYKKINTMAISLGIFGFLVLVGIITVLVFLGLFKYQDARAYAK